MSEQQTAAVLPLTRAFFCLDCEVLFEIAGACPACGGGQVELLSRFLDRARSADLIAITEIEHHLGNGLQAAKTRAELFRAQLARGPCPGELAEHGKRELTRIIESIDHTMARIRALRKPSAISHQPSASERK